MLDYIKGTVAEINPASAVIENNGLGFMLQISLNTYTAINGKTEAKLFVYEAIREDAVQLFGFSDPKERELFLLLISVSGVGATTARMLLSSAPPAELASIIVSGNEKMLKNVKGIGLKTAQRIIVDLKDKIKPSDSIASGFSPARSQLFEEAVAALVALGFQQSASSKAVEKILKENPSATIEQTIKTALKML